MCRKNWCWFISEGKPKVFIAGALTIKKHIYMGKMREAWEGEAAGHRWGDGAQGPCTTGSFSVSALWVFEQQPCKAWPVTRAAVSETAGQSLWRSHCSPTHPLPCTGALWGCFCVEGTELKCPFALDMCIKGQFLCLNTLPNCWAQWITLGFTQDPADEFPVSLTKMSTYNSVRRLLTQKAVRPFWLKEKKKTITLQIKQGRHLNSQFVIYLSKASFPQHLVEDKAVYVEFSPCSSWHWFGCVYLPELIVLAVICWAKQGGKIQGMQEPCRTQSPG